MPEEGPGPDGRDVAGRPLGHATWTDVAASPRRLLAVPVGSLEQHGPHLPLDTDTQIATALVARIVRARPKMVAAPALPFGASGEHAAFPGTLSLNHDVVAHALIEIARSARAAFRATVIVSAHGGNEEALRRVERHCAADGDAVLVCRAEAPDGDAHAGRTETSVMLALAPELVRVERIEPGCTAPLPSIADRLRAEGVGAVSANGVLGNPQGSNAPEGERLLEAMVARLLGRIDAFAASLPSTEGSP